MAVAVDVLRTWWKEGRTRPDGAVRTPFWRASLLLAASAWVVGSELSTQVAALGAPRPEELDLGIGCRGAGVATAVVSMVAVASLAWFVGCASIRQFHGLGESVDQPGPIGTVVRYGWRLAAAAAGLWLVRSVVAVIVTWGAAADGCDAEAGGVRRGLTLGAVAILALAAAAAAVGALARRRQARARQAPPVAPAARPRVVRVLVVAEAFLVFMFLFFGDLSNQITEAARRWLPGGAPDGRWLLPLVVALAALALLTATSAGAIHALDVVAARELEPVPTLLKRALEVLAVACLVAGFLLAQTRNEGHGLIAFGVIVGVILLISAVPDRAPTVTGAPALPEVDPDIAPESAAEQAVSLTEADEPAADAAADEAAPVPDPTGLGWWLIAIPAVTVATVVARVAVLVFVRGGDKRPQALAVAALSIAACVAIAAAGVIWRERLGRLLGWWVPALAGVGLTVLTWVAVPQLSIDAEQRLGGIGLVLVFFAELFLGAALVSWAAERWTPPAALRLLGLQRIPVLSLLLVWALLGAYLARNSGVHDVRRVAPGHEAAAAIEPEARFRDWLDAQDDDEDTVPLVMVTASGGGIRAAAWTATMLDCVFDLGASGPSRDDVPAQCPQAPFGRLFAANGASGGNVGIASAVAEHLAPSGEPDWIDSSLGDDHITASLVQQLFREAPNLLPRLRWGSDRAAHLERSWEASWPDREGNDPCYEADKGFVALQVDCGVDVPLMLFNGTNTRDGCRVNIAAVDADGGRRGCRSSADLDPAGAGDGNTTGTARWPASDDLLDLLCDKDVPFSTAAFLGARFPFVSPAGRVPAACGEEAMSVVDGGYRDNSGASQMADLWRQLAPLVAEHNARGDGPCVRPILVTITNGYRSTVTASPPDSFSELLRPIEALTSVGIDRGPELLQRLVGEVEGAPTAVGDCADADPERFDFALRKLPGSRAPLGWTLSSATLDEFESQLQDFGDDDDTSHTLTDLRDILRPE